MLEAWAWGLMLTECLLISGRVHDEVSHWEQTVADRQAKLLDGMQELALSNADDVAAYKSARKRLSEVCALTHFTSSCWGALFTSFPRCFWLLPLLLAYCADQQVQQFAGGCHSSQPPQTRLSTCTLL